MKILTAITVIGTALLLARTRYRIKQWERTLEQFEAKLLGEPPLAVQAHQSWEELPAIVQRYLARVLPQGHRSIANLRLEQVGEYRLQSQQHSSSWVKMEATELLSTNPPGFVFDAVIVTHTRTPWPTTIQVCDVWADGEAYRNSAWMNSLDLHAPNPEDEQLILGEAMRWLGETVLVPTILLPQEGLVTWSQSQGDEEDNTAILNLQDPHFQASQSGIHLEATFDDDEGFLTHLKGLRPFWTGNEFVMKQWQGRYSDYRQQVDGIWVPAHMESGFFEKDQLELYFKGTNILMEFNMTHEPQLLEEDGDATKTE